MLSSEKWGLQPLRPICGPLTHLVAGDLCIGPEHQQNFHPQVDSIKDIKHILHKTKHNIQLNIPNLKLDLLIFKLLDNPRLKVPEYPQLFVDYFLSIERKRPVFAHPDFPCVL